MNVERLQEKFVNGNTPKKVNGFYRGRLDRIISTNLIETFGEIILSMFLPWKGKWFDAKNNCGDNILPTYIISSLKLNKGKDFEIKKEFGGVHAFTFKTSIQKGLKDDIGVLRLDYNITQNPPTVRRVIDELVEVDKDSYLGKAHIKEENSFRTIAFFTLNR